MDTLDPFSPRALYLMAHHATWAGAYFQRVVRLARLTDHPDDRVIAYRQRLFSALKEEQAYARGLVVAADQLARAHGFDVPPAPTTPDAWDPWVRGIFRGVRGEVDLAVPTSSPFTFGWEHGQARATLAVLMTLVEMTARGVDARDELTKGRRTLAEIAARWPAAAALLSRVEGTEALIAAWRPAAEELLRLGRSDMGQADAEGIEAIGLAARRLLEALGELEHVAAADLAPHA